MYRLSQINSTKSIFTPKYSTSTILSPRLENYVRAGKSYDFPRQPLFRPLLHKSAYKVKFLSYQQMMAKNNWNGGIVECTGNGKAKRELKNHFSNIQQFKNHIILTYRFRSCKHFQSPVFRPALCKLTYIAFFLKTKQNYCPNETYWFSIFSHMLVFLKHLPLKTQENAEWSSMRCWLM